MRISDWSSDVCSSDLVRRHLDFSCRGHRLAASIDEGRMDTGLLIVSGGNELRSGAHRGMAKLAARLARDGFPVFRFDRRGVGDSEGENGGFLSSDRKSTRLNSSH